MDRNYTLMRHTNLNGHIKTKTDVDPRSLLVHQLAWLGTDDSIEVLRQLLLTGRLSSRDATDWISSLSLFLRAPNDRVLQQLLVIVFFGFSPPFTELCGRSLMPHILNPLSCIT